VLDKQGRKAVSRPAKLRTKFWESDLAELFDAGFDGAAVEVVFGSEVLNGVWEEETVEDEFIGGAQISIATTSMLVQTSKVEDLGIAQRAKLEVDGVKYYVAALTNLRFGTTRLQLRTHQ